MENLGTGQGVPRSSVAKLQFTILRCLLVKTSAPLHHWFAPSRGNSTYAGAKSDPARIPYSVRSEFYRIPIFQE